MRGRGVIKRLHPDLIERIENVRRDYEEKTGRECTFVEASGLLKPSPVRFVGIDKKKKQRFIDLFG